MSNLRGFKQGLSTVSQLREEKAFDRALGEVESLLKLWPGNAHLHVLWASLEQLQENTTHDPDEAKQALQKAIELDKTSPVAAIEFGHFLDNVEDNPLAATIAFADGVSTARRLLIEGLIGQAKAYRQLGKREEFLRCLREVLQIARFETGSKKAKPDESEGDIIFESPIGSFHAIELMGPYAEQIQELLSEVLVTQ